MRILTATLTILTCLLLQAGCSETSSDAPPEKPSVAPEARTPAEPAHPQDAVAFGGHWYKVYEDKEQELSWHEKKKLCEKAGGYLACIESEQEQQFIKKFVDDRYLSLGATDEKEEGEWRWVNGAKWDYTAWMGGQPNNYAGSEHYLATYDDGLWVDVADEGYDFWMPVGYICEWEK